VITTARDVLEMDALRAQRAGTTYDDWVAGWHGRHRTMETAAVLRRHGRAIWDRVAQWRAKVGETERYAGCAR
jgi:hypothetical protein